MALGALALLSVSAWAHAGAPTYRFHIEGQPLNQALQVFSDQSGLQIVYHTELLPDTATQRVEGTYDAQTALNRLLRGTGLVARQVNARTFAIATQEVSREIDSEVHATRALRVADERPDSPLLAQVTTQSTTPVTSPPPVSVDDNSGAQLAEVVVTAQKRAENVQDVPIAITAYSESDLRSKGITDIHGLSRLTPNVNLDAGAPFSGSNSVLSASIRGIGQDDFAFNLDPAVGGLCRRRVLRAYRRCEPESSRCRAHRDSQRTSRHAVRTQYDRWRDQHRHPQSGRPARGRRGGEWRQLQSA
jgi:hypothetical protein